MKRLLPLLLLLFPLEMLTACGDKGKSSGPSPSNGTAHIVTFLEEMSKDTTIGNPLKETAKTLLTDNLRWWGIKKICTDSLLFQEEYHYQLNQINQVMEWCGRKSCPPFIKGILWNQKGLCYIRHNLTDSALHCFHEAFRLIEPTKNFDQLSTIAINLGTGYFSTGNTPMAAKYFKQAAFWADSLHTSPNQLAISIGLAQMYNNLNNFTLAHQHLDKAQQILGSGTRYDRYHYYTVRGICYYYQKKYALSYQSFEKALRYAENIGGYQRTMCHASLGESALMNGNPPLALQHIQPCIRFLYTHQQLNDPSLVFFIGSLSADVLMANGKEQEAKQLLTLLPNEKDIKIKRFLSLHYLRMASYAEAARQYEKAYHYLQNAKYYKEIDNNESDINNIIEIYQRYQRDTTQLRQHFTLASMQAEKSRYQLRLTVIIGSAVLAIFGCLLGIFIIRRHNEKIYQNHLRQIAQLRMDVVRNRISPHFIFNVLGMMLPKFKANPELYQLSELFIDVIRANLVSSSQVAGKLAVEKQLVQQYIRLYHLSTHPYPAVHWTDTTGGKADEMLVPAMCLQIPVENALKHAFSSPDEHCRIDITLQLENERLLICITDNGNGYDPGKVTATGRDTGTGLRVLSRTISLLNRQNSHSINFSIRNLAATNGKGTEVRISIPFNYQYK